MAQIENTLGFSPVCPIRTMMSLAVLSRQFFMDQPPHSDLYQKWQASFAWNEAILPIYEWDSILYVGVTEHHELTFDFPCVQVLCDPEDLKNVWQVFQATHESTDGVAPASDFVVSTAPAGGAIPQAVDDGDQFTALSQVSGDAPEASEKDGDPFASLEGTLAPSKLNSTGSPTDLLEADSAETPENKHDDSHSQMSVETTQDDAPGGLEMNSAAPKLSFDMPTGSVLKATEPVHHEEKTQAVEIPVEEEVAETIQPIPAMPAKAAKPAAPPEIAATKPAASANLSSRKPLSQPAGMPAFTPPKPTPGAKPVGAAAPTPSGVAIGEVTVSQIARTGDTFTQMHNYFQKSMILKVEGKSVKPWKWDDRFKPAAQTSDMDLDTPSPFRIVNRTAKPYHGYIVANELNEKFFQEWNNNEIPDHLTLAPVVVDDQVVAMLMGIGDKASDNKLSLQHAEKIAAKLSVEMKQAAAKAA